MAQPVQAKHSSFAFTRWLSTMTKSSAANGMEVQKELSSLQHSDDQLDRIIEKASQIVRRNNDQFSFEINESAASQQVYQLLLIEWSQFQTGNAMASVPIQQNVKITVPVKIDNTGGHGSSAYLPDTINQLPYSSDTQACSFVEYGSCETPMASGIAIGAP